MSDADLRRRLESVYALFRKIEHEAEDGRFPAADLTELAKRLEALGDEERIEVSKLAQIVPHLDPGMSLRTFVALMIPVERALEKTLRDDDFLVTTTDRPGSTADGRAPVARQTLPVRLVLDNLRSAFNVGSILRTADGFGAEKIHLCGYTPSPDEGKTARTALGADAVVPWERVARTEDVLEALKKSGWHVVALETSPRALDLDAPFPDVPTAFVLGNERFGLSPSILRLCDDVRRLPLIGVKNSLNVATIAALSLYEWKKQWLAK